MFWTKKEQKPLELTEKSYERLVNAVYDFYTTYKVYDVNTYHLFSISGYYIENLRELDSYKRDDGSYDWGYMTDTDLKEHLKSLDVNLIVEKVTKLLERYYSQYDRMPRMTAEDNGVARHITKENEKTKKYFKWTQK